MSESQAKPDLEKLSARVVLALAIDALNGDGDATNLLVHQMANVGTEAEKTAATAIVLNRVTKTMISAHGEITKLQKTPSAAEFIIDLGNTPAARAEILDTAKIVAAASTRLDTAQLFLHRIVHNFPARIENPEPIVVGLTQTLLSDQLSLKTRSEAAALLDVLQETHPSAFPEPAAARPNASRSPTGPQSTPNS